MKYKINENNKEIITITKNDLASVALLYNFLANDSMTLPNHKINEFYDYIRFNHYYRSNTTFEFVEEHENPVTPRYFNLVESIEKHYSEYEALDIDYLIDYYHHIPPEIIDKTISEKSFSIVGVNPEKIPIIPVTENYCSHINIYAMSEEGAMRSASHALYDNYYENIKIHSAFYEGMKSGDHLYKVNYSASRTFDTIDIEQAKKKVLGKFRKDVKLGI